MKHKILKIIITIASFIFLFLMIAIISNNTMKKEQGNTIFGLSFSPYYAKYLNLDAKEAFREILQEMDFKYIRLTAQWDKIEAKRGVYNFTDLDWMMKMAVENKAKIILTVGRKTPRWPECHIPEWAKKMQFQEYKGDLHKFIEQVVNRYKDNPALEIWQVENEPYLAFGECSVMASQDLRDEIDLVRSLDNMHKVMVTDSGELSWWRKTAQAGDLFGTTMYRVVWNRFFGYFSYDWMPAKLYNLKLMLNKRELDEAYIVELQAEPWIPAQSVHATPLGEQYKSFSMKRLEKNIDYATRTGMPRAYLWGAEWWIWVEKQYGVGQYIEYIKTLRKD
ncbi:MAG: beta-galactosidase [bacterium]